MWKMTLLCDGFILAVSWNVTLANNHLFNLLDRTRKLIVWPARPSLILVLIVKFTSLSTINSIGQILNRSCRQVRLL